MTEPHNTKWLSYQQASEWAQSQNIMTYDQWTGCCAAGLPEGVPVDPQTVYGDEFIGWHEFLGVQLSRDGRKVFWSYERARDWARGAGIKTGVQWEQMSKDKVLPIGVPAQPYKVYKGKFQNWGEFLGTGHVATKDKAFMSYEEAKNWALLNKITSLLEWKSKRKELAPEGIPAHPDRVYKEFTNWGEFLRTGRIANKDREFLSYEEASAWAQEEGIGSPEEWYYKSKKDFPKNIPVAPHQIYGKEFRWHKFLNYQGKRYFGRNKHSNENCLPYSEALNWARNQGICSSVEWQKRCRDQLPQGIPAYPHKVYSEFTNWGDFLGLQIVHGMSKIERMMRYVLETALNDQSVDYSQPIITDLSGKKHRVDMCFPSINLIVEYDGSYWHQNKQTSDVKKTKALLNSQEKWQVIRVRGNPLPLLREDWDVSVDETDCAATQIFTVLQHLLELNHSNKIDLTNDVCTNINQWNIEKISKINFRKILEKYDSFKSYEEAVAWAKEHKIESGQEWKERSKNGLNPGFPSCPATSYGVLFKGWGDFLGTGRICRNRQNIVSYEEASNWAQNQGITSAPQWWAISRSGKIPDTIPASPSVFYKEEFKKRNGWYGFLGKEPPKGRLR